MVSEPIFLVGAERSGTTLLRLMLDSHPQIAFLFESEFIVDQIAPDGTPPPIEAYWEWLATHRIFGLSGLNVDRSLDYFSLVRSFLEQKRQRDGKPIVGATVHRNFDRLVSIWPQAKFIHLCRDGRDVARSVIAEGWAANGWMAVERWLTAERLWEEVKAKLPQARHLDVRYESLIRSPENTLTEICDFIGVGYTPAMFDYAKQTSYALPNPSAIGQWQKTFNVRHVRLVEARAAAVLEARGYAASGHPKLSVTPQHIRLLALQDRMGRAWFRLRRYGLPLFVANALVNRGVGSRRWQQSVRLRTDDVTNRYLK